MLIDLLALNLFADLQGQTLPGDRSVAVVSPWLSDVELTIPPGPWYQRMVGSEAPRVLRLGKGLELFLQCGWTVEVAVLAYGANFSGMTKKREAYRSEVDLLSRLLTIGVRIYQVPDLHAKGVVTPLGVITGSTNLTYSGVFLQGQNVNYFARTHPDFWANRVQLLNRFRTTRPCTEI